MNIPEYYEDMSLRLTEVLNASGLGDDIRWQRINYWLYLEELDRILTQTIFDSTDIKTFYFGSQPEATTTDELLSDIDKVGFAESDVVLQDLQFWEFSPNTERTFLMVTDEDTPPGYVKLQLVQRDAPILVNNYQDEIIRLDSKGRSVLCNNTEEVKQTIAHEYHGPANTSHNIGMTMDIVIAMHTRYWPDQVSQWLSSKSRNYNWPTKGLIDVIQGIGALLVPVGHKLSHEHHLEWRLSFSFLEKVLTWQFNSTQYKCYVMLKFIKNAFINADDQENVLTSYHLKTCMFHMIEYTPASLWHPNKLLICIDLCLRQMLSWVECKYCPNYFIPDENMFLGRMLDRDQKNIADILRDLLRQKGVYLTRIPYQNIGENVVRVCQSLPMELYNANEKNLRITLFYLNHILDFVCISVVNHNVCKINVSKGSQGPRHEAVSLVRSLVCSSLGNHIASQSLEEELPNEDKLAMAHELLLWGSSSDPASGNLKLAAFYLAQSNFDAVEEVLNLVDANLTHNVWEESEMDQEKCTLSKIVRENLSIAALVQHHFALTVCYGILDIHIVPKVLIFEMFRSTGSESGIDRLVMHWIPIAIVKARLCLYFLQYQCFHLQGRVAQRLVALKNMIWICKRNLKTVDNFLAYVADVSWRPDFTTVTLIHLSNVTTTLNMLAYCLKQDERQMDVFNVLCKSMKMKNQHNAAKWQIATFINSAVRISNGRQ